MTIQVNVPANAKASNVFIEAQRARTAIEQLSFIPQKLSLIGQYDPAKVGVTDFVPFQVSSSGEVGSMYGFGHMLHLMAIKAFNGLGNSGIPVYVHPIPEDGGATASVGSYQVVGPATSPGVIPIRISDQVVNVNVANGDTANDIAALINTALGGVLSLPVTTSVLTDTVTLTSKWKGETANNITLAAFINSTETTNRPAGVSLVITDMVGGTVNPDSAPVFDAMGSTWFTRLAFPYTDAANLTALQAAGDERHLPTVIRTIIPLIGDNTAASSISSVITFWDAFNSPWINPVWRDTLSLPFEIAADAAGTTIVRAQVDPARPYSGQVLRGIRPTDPVDTLKYADLNSLENAGVGVTIINVNGETQILDLNTTEKTDQFTDPLPNFQTRTVLWSNIQAKTFSIEALLTTAPFVGAKVVDNDAVTAQPYAISPKKLKTALVNLIDTVWLPNAWTKNRDVVVASIITEIDAFDPERLNAQIDDDQAVGWRLFAVAYRFGASSEFE